VSIGLMPDVPDQLIVRSIEDIMDSSCKFNNPETGPEMTGISGYDFEDELPDLLAELRQFFNRKYP
jgi:hypothetical protein